MVIRLALLVVVAQLATVAFAASQVVQVAGVLPAPVLPETIRRDGDKATVRAVRLEAPLHVDGRLDEAVYTTVVPMSDFTQLEPLPGQPSSDRSEVWVFFDEEYFYFSARCWQDPAHLVANEMRRDAAGVIAGDYIGFALDTFYDRRNGMIINIGAAGGRRDGLVTDERQFNVDWNGVYTSATARFDGGWSVEVALPFKSVRYRSGANQVWSFNVHRGHTWRNEKSFLMPMTGTPPGGALMRFSLAATLVGLEAPPAAKNIEMKPYVATNVTGVTRPTAASDFDANVGLDAKYGVTEGLTGDFTLNTDFAQVEVDEQQINLTRFSLFFPEKREFFLENAGVFAFAGAPGGGSLTPVLFYSRRIGLNAGRVVPIEAGGRLTGRAGKFSIGALSIRAGEETASRTRPTTFSVMRIKRDLLRRSSVGLIATHRSESVQRVGAASGAFGADAAFAFYNNLTVNTYWAATRSPGTTDGQASYRAQLDYTSDRYGLQAEHLLVGEHFNPEIGFVRRPDARRDFAQARFSPRFRSHPFVRRLIWSGLVDYTASSQGALQTRVRSGEFGVELNSGDSFEVGYDDQFEFVPAPFSLAPGVRVPVGGYGLQTLRGRYTFGQQRPVSGSVTADFGSFYDGTKTTVGITQGRIALSSRLSVAPSYTINRARLPQASFTSHLTTTRVVYTMTPLMFVSALVQFNSISNTVSANVRWRWEYLPGSELFVVYNEERDSRTPGFPGLMNRAFIVKVNRLFRF